MIVTALIIAEIAMIGVAATHARTAKLRQRSSRKRRDAAMAMTRERMLYVGADEYRREHRDERTEARDAERDMVMDIERAEGGR